MSRWKESTLTLPFEASKTAWPVSNIESLFLPEFPVSPLISQNFINIVEFIAYGAFGKVYKVKEKTSDKLYALKVLSKSKVYINIYNNIYMYCINGCLDYKGKFY